MAGAWEGRLNRRGATLAPADKRAESPALRELAGGGNVARGSGAHREGAGPSPAASSCSPSPFPHVWVTSKFREKAAWWLPKQRRDSAAQRSPPRGA